MALPHPLRTARRADRASLPRHRRADAEDPPARPPARGEASVNELTEALGASQQNVSKHAVLAEAEHPRLQGRHRSTGSSMRASSLSASRYAAPCSSGCALSTKLVDGVSG